jgi:hypothetical protein
MNFSTEIYNALQIIALDAKVMRQVAKEPRSLHFGIIFVALASLLMVLNFVFFPVDIFGMVIFRPDAPWVFSRFMWGFALGMIFLYVLGFMLERLTKRKLKMDEFVRVAAYSSVVNFLMFFPYLNLAAGVWQLVIFWKIFKSLD